MTAFEFETIDKSLKISAARYENKANREPDVGVVLVLTSGRLAIEAARSRSTPSRLVAGRAFGLAMRSHKPNPTGQDRPGKDGGE